MPRNILFMLFLFINISMLAQWKPAGDKIKTDWAKKIDAQKVLPEYPRPILERPDWKNLNGLWEYAIVARGKSAPSKYDGKILVPFAVESSLSGVMKTVGAKKGLWYRTEFEVPTDWGDRELLLHFGAVDWKTDVWINDIMVGSHEGGYTPFTFNITPFLVKGKQKMIVKVWDPTDEGPQPRGKQVKEPKGIWYTPVTGIWQTVWLEPVPKKSIASLKTVPDIDTGSVQIDTEIIGGTFGDVVAVTIFDEGKAIATTKSAIGAPLVLGIADAKLWSPESPVLYDMEVELLGKDSETGQYRMQDKVKSYFGMRKISMKKDDFGIVRMQLNNKDYFQFGPLDQGWWPDGLYTAPTDEALKYDIEKTKELGFNLIRKHVKVEPARWYTHCDRMGILVWQDMPSGDQDNNLQWQNHSYFDGSELIRTAKSESIFRKEWKGIMDYLYSHPSIVSWVPFNEAWGQFKTKEISDWTKAYDPSRLVNAASGGNFYRTGDIVDLHNYPGPAMYLYDAERTNVLGEFGGIGLALEGHLWRPDENWGYIKFKNSEETTDQYVAYAEELRKMVRSGFSGAIYTQTTDVEGEVNGFMTYDRKVDKMNLQKVKEANQAITNELHK